MTEKVFDLAVVGGGIVGLAHALAARRLGKRVVLLEREPANTAASIRNFGFVTVTGQAHGAQWRRALRSRDVWEEIAAPAGISVLQTGMAMALRTGEAHSLAEALMDTEMGRDCALMTPAAAARRLPGLRTEGLASVLYSPHERRVEASEAIPALTAWLREGMGVDVRHNVTVREVAPPRIETSAGPIAAEACAVCPGSDLSGLFPEALAPYGVTKCKLHMLRAMPERSDYRLPSAVMNDLSLVRYPGYADMPQSAALKRRLAADTENARALSHGIHLIAVQSADGSLVVGDSHQYTDAPDPFQSAEVDDAILAQAHRTLACGSLRIRARWTGVYASADRPNLILSPADRTRMVVITTGTGMSTAFAIAEEVIGELFEADPERVPLAAVRVSRRGCDV